MVKIKKTISKDREKVAKWLDLLPIFYETGSVAPEYDMKFNERTKM